MGKANGRVAVLTGEGRPWRTTLLGGMRGGLSVPAHDISCYPAMVVVIFKSVATMLPRVGRTVVEHGVGAEAL